MQITYTGKLEPLNRDQKKKLDERYARLGKLLANDSKKAHVILNAQRHLQACEVTIHFMDKEMAGAAKANEQFSALTNALEKLETQVLKAKEKRRSVKRKPEPKAQVAVPNFDPTGEPTGRKVTRKIHVVAEDRDIKPMSAEEAALELTPGRPYLVFRNDRHELQVLIRRPDGHFDLVTCG